MHDGWRELDGGVTASERAKVNKEGERFIKRENREVSEICCEFKVLI